MQQGFRKASRMGGLLAAVLLCLALPAAAPGAEVHRFANGVTATVHSAVESAGAMTALTVAGTAAMDTPFGRIVLDADTAGCVPFAEEYVTAALRELELVTAGVEVSVYILPAMPLGDVGSFARQNAIFLAPGSGKVDESTVSYITTHEMGHVLTWAFLDGQADRWDAYMALRGLDPLHNGPAAIHAERAREILAEDIRFLFGGPHATWPGSIENHHLTLPNQVPGLKTLLSGYFAIRDSDPALVASSAFPNPCNPLTTIAMDLPMGDAADGASAVLRVFDIRGALVQTVNGGHVVSGRLAVQWDGCTVSGSLAASGRYVYVLQCDKLVAKGAVTLVR